MRDQFVQAFIDKLIFLEQKTGDKVTYRLMHPLNVPALDCIAIQVLAKEIAAFIGLTGFTFVVALCKQGTNVGGHIDLSTDGQEVFIEVDKDMMELPDAVAATICHELCHKWLQVHGIHSAIEVDNEILTDITSVFLGLGGIMLNGCRTTNVRQEPSANGTRTITTTLATGYLDRDQLAFVYRLVCAMRRIPASEFMRGLNAEAKRAVERCDSLYGHHYAPRFHRTEAAQETVAHFDNRVVEVQRTLAHLDKHMSYIKKSLCTTIEEFLICGHKTLDALRRKASLMTQREEVDPALRFLRAIETDFEVKMMVSKTSSLLEEADGLLRHAQKVSLHLNRNKQQFPPPSPEMFNIVTCPIDSTRLRLPEESQDLSATCPACRYRFAYNTSAMSFAQPSPPRPLAWLKKIRDAMRHKKSGKGH